MIIQQEHYSEGLLAELEPLVQRNWIESESSKNGLKVDPAMERYIKLDQMGALVCLTARETGLLVGYLVFTVDYSLHHKSILCGKGDAVYVEFGPGRGGIAKDLIHEAERHMKARGVQRIGWYANPESRLHLLLRAMGYLDDEVVMEKVL